MQQSPFVKFYEKYFAGIVLRVIELLNGTTSPVVFYHKRFCDVQFSVDGKWESLNSNNTAVMADVVSMDSELPLKKRDVINRASGDIPKQGMTLQLNEKQLTELDTLALDPRTQPQLITKLFQNTPKVIRGIDERNEQIFLEALSSGVSLVDDSDNVGIGVRMNYNYQNKFGVTTVWSNPAALPLDDLSRIKFNASTAGNNIIKFLMDRTTFTNFAKTTQVKEEYAFFIGFTGGSIKTPSLTQINQATQDKYGYVIEIMERTVTAEKNGVRTSINPWQTGSVIGITSENLGTLVWARLAESNHPSENVTYATAQEYTLVSTYRLVNPLREITHSQARVVPVLTNTDQIYQIDSTVVQA